MIHYILSFLAGLLTIPFIFGAIYLSIIIYVLYHGFGNYRKGQNVDVILVLGAQVFDYTPSNQLKYRLDEAINFAEKFPDAKIIVSGGKGTDEKYSEAKVMARYIKEHSDIKNEIILEDKSTSTFQNIQLSRELIDEDNDSVLVISNPFHIARIEFLAKRLHFKCHTYGAKSKLYARGIFREPIAFIVSATFNRKRG